MKFLLKVRAVFPQRENNFVFMMVLILANLGLGVAVALEQYLPIAVVGLVIASGLAVVSVKPPTFFLFLFAIGAPISYSYALLTGSQPGAGLIWPRIGRDFALLLLIANVALRAIKWTARRLWFQWMYLPLFLWLLYTSVLAFFSVDLPLTTFWVGVKHYLIFPLIGLLIPLTIKDKRVLCIVFRFLFGVAILVAVIGIAEVFIGDPFDLDYDRGRLFGLRVTRASSLWGNPLSLAGYLGMVVAFWQPLKKHLGSIFQGWGEHVFTFILWTCLLLTLSRSSVIAVLAAFGVKQIFLSDNRINLLWGALLLAIVIPVLNLLSWIRRPSSLGEFGLLPGNLRFDLWNRLMKQFLENGIARLWFGRGLGANSGIISLEGIQALNFSLDKAGSLTTDSFYLTVLFEAGAIGLILFGFVCLAYFGVCINLYRRTENDFYKSVYAGILVSMTFFLIRNLVLQGMRTFLAGFYFWVLIGMMVAVNNIDHLTDSSSAQAA